jgi:hypothetical protein
MREAFDKIFAPILAAIDIRSKIEWWIKLVFWLVLLWPANGIVWEQRTLMLPLIEQIPGIANPASALELLLGVVTAIILGGMAVKGVDLYLAQKTLTVSTPAPIGADGKPAEDAPKISVKTQVLAPYNFKPKSLRFKKDEEPYVEVGDMLFTEKDLYTSTLITGVTGTGKTSAAVFPMLEQIFSIYNEEGDGSLGSIGGLCLDVKGEFFEGIIYYMHQSGRNIFEDIQVIRPNCLMPVTRFKDPKTGYCFFLNAKPCSSGAEAWDLIRGKKFKDGMDIPLNIFTFGRKKLESYEAKLKEMVFEVAGKKFNYIGWRWQGDKIVRVGYTPKFNETHCLLENGERIVIDAPQSLVYDGMVYVDNNLRYNIVEPHKPSPEAAMRLNLISTLAEGEKQSGENAYWYKRARSHIGSCIELWRLAYEETPQCTAQDIYKITQQDDYCRKQVKLVEGKIKTLQTEAAKIEDFSDKVAIEREIERMTSIVKYFTEEWGKYDTKTKTIVGSVVANAFDTFNKDPILQDSFCQPKTFSFEQCIQEGKIFVLVAGDEYETVAKILGTALKMDFQSVVLSRMHRSELNQKRKIMLVNDECQKFVVAGGSQGAGDEHFMSLCRQSRCFNINATQADSWIISVVGKENADVYLQNYNGRIWFRTNDKDTAEKAEQLCGIKKQKTRSAGSEKVIHLENLFMGPKGSADMTPTFSEKEEEKPRFAKDKFYNLEKWECIVFNGTRTGSDKACQSQCEPAFIGSEDGQKAVRDVMKLYFQGYLENIVFRQNGGKTFSHIPTAKPVAGSDISLATAAATVETETALHASGKPIVSSAHTQVPLTIATAETTAPRPNPISVPQASPSLPNLALTPEGKLGPAPDLKSFGEEEALKTRANKMLKSVQITPIRAASFAEGTIAPFTSIAAIPPQEFAAPANASVRELSALPASNDPLSQLPLVTKDFDPATTTPANLIATQQSYNKSPASNLEQTLESANFVPPVNPDDYLPARQEQELEKAGDPALAAERAALGPLGKQGGNPSLAMTSGGVIEVPTAGKDAFDKLREKGAREDTVSNGKAFVAAISSQPGPQPDSATLELLKNLKPETDDTQK